MRWLLLLFIAGGIGTGVFLGEHDFLSPRHSSTAQETGNTARATQPGRRIFAAGHVEGIQRDIPLRFELAGRVEEILVAEGDMVRKGDVMFQLEAEVWKQNLAEARARLMLARAERMRLVNGARSETREVAWAEVRTAEVQVREAESLLARGRKLALRNAISAQELDDQIFKVDRAAAVLNAAKARAEELEAPVRDDELAMAEARVALAEVAVRHEQALLDKTRLCAPVDGVILHVAVETGELVGPDDSQPLVTMVNWQHTRIRAYVEELDALAVAPGQSAYAIADGQPGRKHPGTVVSCAPSVRSKSLRHNRPGELVDVKVREVVIELRDGADLVIGLPVEVFIEPELPPSGTPDGTAQPSPDDDATGETAL